MNAAILIGLGAVVAALPAFSAVRDFVLSIEGGPTRLARLCWQLAVASGMEPALMHRVAVPSAGTLDSPAT